MNGWHGGIRVGCVGTLVASTEPNDEQEIEAYQRRLPGVTRKMGKSAHGRHHSILLYVPSSLEISSDPITLLIWWQGRLLPLALGGDWGVACMPGAWCTGTTEGLMPASCLGGVAKSRSQQRYVGQHINTRSMNKRSETHVRYKHATRGQRMDDA